jgi:hypothetical protein
MGGALEAAKLVAASWTYRHWSIAPFLMKSYMTTAVLVLIFITSMGIFGYLSKSHLEQTMMAGDNSVKLEQIEIRIQRQQKIINDADTVIGQLDQTVQTLMDYDRIRGPEGALATRRGQKEERDELNTMINQASDEIAALQEEKAQLSIQQLEVEAEIGPLKYIAELVYGDEAQNYFDKAVRYIIILIVSVFDPLAVCLLLAGNHGIMHRYRKIKDGKPVIEIEEENIIDNINIEEPVLNNKEETKNHGVGYDGGAKRNLIYKD